MCVKFQVPSFHTFGDTLRTKIPEKQEGHDGPGVAHLSLLTMHNQFPTSCEIYVLPNNKILNSSV